MNQIETADLTAAVTLITKDMTTAKRVGLVDEKLDKIGSQYTGKELDAFVAGSRFAIRRFNTALKNAGSGKDKARLGAPKPAKKAAPAKAKSTPKSTPASGKTKQAALDKGAKKAPRGQTKADKGQPVTPTQKAAAAKKAPAAKKVATVTNIGEARGVKKAPAKKIVRQVVQP